jgi:uncharacterized membrane protein YvbJ
MSLIKCEECGTEVSDKAGQCLKCGCPIEAPRDERVQTIEQTSKNLKLQLLIGSVILILGFISMFVFGFEFITLTLLFIGIVVVVLAKISIWWNHH